MAATQHKTPHKSSPYGWFYKDEIMKQMLNLTRPLLRAVPISDPWNSQPDSKQNKKEHKSNRIVAGLIVLLGKSTI